MAIFREIKVDIGKILRQLCQQKGIEIIEAELCPDHIHMLISIPPKYGVSQIMGYVKGKSSLMIFDRHANLKYKYGNRHFWARGYFVDAVFLYGNCGASSSCRLASRFCIGSFVMGLFRESIGLSTGFAITAIGYVAGGIFYALYIDKHYKKLIKKLEQALFLKWLFNFFQVKTFTKNSKNIC